MLAAIERIVKGECVTAGSPREPEFEYYDQFPLTSNDAGVTDKVTAAFTEHFGAGAVHPGHAADRVGGLQPHPGRLRRALHVLAPGRA